MRIHHLALRVGDPERSLAFYAGLLGLREVRRFEAEGALRSVWLETGTALLMLERGLRGSGVDVGSGHLLAFEVDDLGGWERRLQAAGIRIDDRTEATLYVQDPDGHRVGLSVLVHRPPHLSSPT